MSHNKSDEAATAFYALWNLVDNAATSLASVETYHAIVALDEAICHAVSENQVSHFVQERVKLVFQKYSGLRSYQARALLRRMSQYGLTKLDGPTIFSKPALIVDKYDEYLGSGSSAVVDTVRMGRKFFARKSVNLPTHKQRQKSVQEDIQKEAKILQSLGHPHIVSVVLT